MKLGEKIRILRTGLHMSQEVLAGLSGISQNAISTYEKSKRVPSLMVANSIATALGMTIDELIANTDEYNDVLTAIHQDEVLQRLTTLFNSLNENGQQTVLSMMEGMVGNPSFSKSASVEAAI